MMAASTENAQKLMDIFSGQPWYGDNIYATIDRVSFEAAYERPAHGVHTVAEILLHMLAWTEEVTERMQGNTAKMPARGDWPDAGAPDEQKWPQLIHYLKLANTNLEKIISDFPEQKWNDLIDDQRGTEPVSTYQGLLDGFLHHQVYHAGQISLLNKQING